MCGGGQKKPGKGLGRQQGDAGNSSSGTGVVLMSLELWQRPRDKTEQVEGEDLAIFSQHPPGHFSHHKPQSQATWLSWKQDGIEQMVSTSQIPIKQGRDR